MKGQPPRDQERWACSFI
ncbi:hypothetical protein E2C01_055706 [Portunus trituberculatus]|uniref:Uncharacterized protein n=1 Tax=Portunus trituberculatus TaxID=210409 RepID=A0A5B7GS01_PORTR|nr:hypothetical protein [Portunus trituberculatus]